MIAGEGIVGILLALFAVFGLDEKIDLSSMIYGSNASIGNWVGLVAFVLLIMNFFQAYFNTD